MENTIGIGKRNRDWLLILSFFAVYVIWGSTYIGIKYAIETIPPFLMAGVRCLIAGFILHCIATFRKETFPKPVEIRNAGLTGIMLLVIGNGGVVWAQQHLDSGIAALLVTIEPIWVVLIIWFLNRDKKPNIFIWIGILLGIAGMALLVGPVKLGQAQNLDSMGVLAITASTISWAIGSVFATKAKMPSSGFYNIAFQMFTGGIIMLLIGTFRNEWTAFEISKFSYNSIAAFIYLILFGSVVGYTAYSYIVKNASPSHASTYAYVNPVIAVGLGGWIGNEIISTQTMFAAGMLVTAVVVILINSKNK